MQAMVLEEPGKPLVMSTLADPQTGPGDIRIRIGACGVCRTDLLVPVALKAVRKGGRVVCAGIHMSDIPSFPYADLWGERDIVSIANLTRADGHAFFAAIKVRPLHTHVTRFPLADANAALNALRRGEIRGAAVIVP